MEPSAEVLLMREPVSLSPTGLNQHSSVQSWESSVSAALTPRKRSVSGMTRVEAAVP